MVKTIQPVKIYLVATLAALTLGACRSPSTPVNVTGVTVIPDSGSARPGETRNFKATVSGTGTVPQTVTWSSSDTKVATVDGTGTVRALTAGKATITATSTADTSKSGGASLTVAVGNTVTKVTVSPDALPLNPGTTGSLTATVEGTGTFAQTVTWSSSDTAVATVDADGVVTAKGAGQAIITAKSTADASKSGSAQVTVGGAASQARLSVTNVDSGPFQTWMSFSKVDYRDGARTQLITQPSPTEHTVGTVKLTNTGSDPLLVRPSVSGKFTLPNGTAQLIIAPGTSVNVPVQFTGSGSGGTEIMKGQLTLTSSDPTRPTTTVTLAGAWQPHYENNPEPTTAQLVNEVLGFRTQLPAGTAINQKGQVFAQGDEVISPYWQKADAGQSVNVWQVASYHTINNPATVYWYSKATSKGAVTLNGIVASAGSDAQSILPRNNGDTSRQARVNGTPPGTTFGFRIDSEWSEPSYNSQSADINAGCTGSCGQHLRFFRAKDPSGAVMPNTYLMVMDYSGINYDYNDNIFLLTNIRPAPTLIDTGLSIGAGSRGAVGVLAPDNNVWLSDQYNYDFTPKGGSPTVQTYKAFTPVEAYDEPNISNPCTTSNVLYRSYRGNTSQAPVNDRTLTYNLPIENGTYAVTLRFMDLYSSRAGQRVFDVRSGSTTLIPNLDIYAQVGACAAYDQTVNVPVTNGIMNLTFAASADYPAISAIEINRP